MKFLTSSLAALALASVSALASAAPVTTTFNFAAQANGAYGESAWSTLNLTGLNITATKGGAFAYAYLDRGKGGLGVCQTLNSAGNAAKNKKTNSGANLCNPGSDDNTTVGEALSFVFAVDTWIDSLSFNNNHDEGFLKGDKINIGVNAVDVNVTGKPSLFTVSNLFVAANTAFDISYNNQEFYVESITYRNAVPEPGSMALLGLGLLGIAAASRRTKRAPR